MADLDRQAYPKLIASRRSVHRMRMPASIAPRGFGMIRPSSVRFVLKLTQEVSRRVGDKGPVLQPGPCAGGRRNAAGCRSKWGGDGKPTARAPLGPHVAAGGGRAPLGA